MKPDNVFAGEHVALSRTAVGIAPCGLKLQPEHFGIEGLIGFKLARGEGDVVDSFDAKADFRNHSCAAPAVRVSSLTRPYKSAAQIVNDFPPEKKTNFVSKTE